MQDLAALEGKTILELREIAKALGIAPSTMKKRELLDKIVSIASAGIPEPVEQTQRKRGRRPRVSGVKVGNGTTEQSPATPEEEEPQAQPRRRGRRPRVVQPLESVEPAEEPIKEEVADEVVEQDIYELPQESIIEEVYDDDDDEEESDDIYEEASYDDE